MLVSFRRAEKFVYSVIIFYKRELIKLLSHALNREKYNRIKTNLDNAKIFLAILLQKHSRETRS